MKTCSLPEFTPTKITMPAGAPVKPMNLFSWWFLRRAGKRTMESENQLTPIQWQQFGKWIHFHSFITVYCKQGQHLLIIVLSLHSKMYKCFGIPKILSGDRQKMYPRLEESHKRLWVGSLGRSVQELKFLFTCRPDMNSDWIQRYAREPAGALTEKFPLRTPKHSTETRNVLKRNERRQTGHDREKKRLTYSTIKLVDKRSGYNIHHSRVGSISF